MDLARVALAQVALAPVDLARGGGSAIRAGRPLLGRPELGLELGSQPRLKPALPIKIRRPVNPAAVNPGAVNPVAGPG